MAVSCGAASQLASALELTPNQILDFSEAAARCRGEGRPRQRRGTPDDFKAAVLGAIGGG